ncbi:MAG: SpoIVB peptidase S55 domain-containing protein [bacterium]
MPLQQIKPGMRGVGKTVFTGTKIEEFEFEVIEIIPNFRAKRDLILVKLIGEKVEKTGVVAGMSGSPAYINGKLIGALAYSMGIFLKEPLAGITPIEQMLEIFNHENVRQEELAFNRGYNAQFLEMALGVRTIKWQHFIPPQFQKVRSQKASVSGMTTLEIPLLFSGFENSVLELSSGIFNGLGFKFLSGGGSFITKEEDKLGSFEAGSAISVVLVDGDFGLQATGTVTSRDGDKILGLGHPFLDMGAVGLPMGKAKILTTISSLMASTKMSALTQVIGTVHQDRTTGVMGVIGEEPEMIPFRLTFRSKFEDNIEFNFRVAEDRNLYSLTPLIFGIVLSNAIESARLSNSNQTLQLNGKINLKGQKVVTLQNYYAGSVPSALLTDAMEATGEIAATLGALLSNNFEVPELESVELNFISHPKKNIATVERIEVDKSVIKPGENLSLTVYIKEYQGKEHKVQHSLSVPEEIDAKRIAIFAGSGGLLTQLEFRAAPQKFKPKSFNQLVTLIENKRKNNFLFFQIRERDNGVLVKGEEFPSLPPSILSVMNSQKTSGNVVSLRDRVLTEENVSLNYSISGGRSIWLRIEPKNK